jgi:hypothetical protein
MRDIGYQPNIDAIMTGAFLELVHREWKQWIVCRQ